MDLIASKAMTYATRRLRAGDTFTARTAADARVLIAVGRARHVNEPQSVGAERGIDALRDEYQEVVGKKPYHGWDADTLAKKIADAKAD
jgi:hypothetical protein